jgi:glucokinase
MGEQLVIVGDCGGTNTRLVLYSIVPNASSPSRGERAPGALIFKKRYKNEDFREFKEIVSVFLKESGIDILPKVACLACAGPIVNNTVDFTNLKGGWFISGSDLQSFFGIEYVQLINDFLAMGYGVLTLNTSECLKVNEALPQEGGVIAVIGAGTGLGECFLTQDPDNKKYTCFPSEGGHCDWSPHNELECELLNYARKKYNHRNRISAERIISGIRLLY